MKVIILDGNQRPALAITRSLGKRGFRVTVGADTIDVDVLTNSQ